MASWFDGTDVVLMFLMSSCDHDLWLHSVNYTHRISHVASASMSISMTLCMPGVGLLVDSVQRTQYPLIKEYTLNHIILTPLEFKVRIHLLNSLIETLIDQFKEPYNSLIKGSGALWVCRDRLARSFRAHGNSWSPWGRAPGMKRAFGLFLGGSGF